MSKSYPPRCVWPLVAFTSNIPSYTYNKDTSNVPPPKSKTNIIFSSSDYLSKPYAIAAAVGSFIIRNILRPAIYPASFVAYLYASLKYAGTVITAESTLYYKNYSAVYFIFINTKELICSA